MIRLLTENDVIENSNCENYENQYVVLKPEFLKLEYRDAKNQLFMAKGGFGCDPTKMGTAVIGFFCGDGESSRVERFDVMGIIKPESLEEWKKVYGEPVEKWVENIS